MIEKGYIIIRAVLILFAIWTALGAVSLGTYQIPINQGGANSPYLVYNPYVELLSIFLASSGGFLLYLTGTKNAEKPIKSARTNTTETVAPSTKN